MKYFHVIRAYMQLIGYFMRLFINLLYGIIKLSRLNQAPVTIFGGSKLAANSNFRQQAQIISRTLTEEGIPVLVGGSSSYLEKGCYDRHHKHKHSLRSIMAINIKSDENQDNPCFHTDMTLSHFASRKWILISYSSGFIIFPGGFGTLSEMTQLLTLIQTNMRKKAPIVLIGVTYWEPFVQWLKDSPLEQRLIEPEHMLMFSVTDSLDEAISIVIKNYSKEFALL